MRRKYFNLGSCPHCGAGKISVTHVTKPTRRFRCRVCDHRWTTLELICDERDWLPRVLQYLLHEGRLTEYFESLPEISAIIATHSKSRR